MFIYSAVTGMGFNNWQTTGGLILLSAAGLFVAAMSSWRATLDPEDAAKKAALSGYKASPEMMKKYLESASKSILFWLIALPTYTVFFMLYTYFVVEAVGLSTFFHEIGINNYSAYVIALGLLPFLCIILFGFLGYYYLRGSELRKFMWRVYGFGGIKTRGYKPERPKSGR